MTQALQSSLRDRIKALSHQRRITAQELWESLVLERFLVRIAQSKHSHHFILKGGVLLARYLDIGRHTKDIDFLIHRVKNEPSTLHKILAEVITLEVDDGFAFSDLSVSPLLHPHMKYQGVRATMKALFGRTRFKVMVDMGCGDLVEPVLRSLSLLATKKAPLFESHVEIACYPEEFIFAEKLESIAYLRDRTSRMKDYHDLYSLCQHDEWSTNQLGSTIQRVFDHRGTPLALPLKFSKAELNLLQPRWSRHLRGIPRSLPEELSTVVGTINDWLQKAMDEF